MNRPPLEVADLIRTAGAAYLERNHHWLSWKTPKASQHDMGWNAERTSPLLPVAGKLFPLTLPLQKLVELDHQRAHNSLGNTSWQVTNPGQFAEFVFDATNYWVLREQLNEQEGQNYSKLSPAAPGSIDRCQSLQRR